MFSCKFQCQKNKTEGTQMHETFKSLRIKQTLDYSWMCKH